MAYYELTYRRVDTGNLVTVMLASDESLRVRLRHPNVDAPTWETLSRDEYTRRAFAKLAA